MIFERIASKVGRRRSHTGDGWVLCVHLLIEQTLLIKYFVRGQTSFPGSHEDHFRHSAGVEKSLARAASSSHGEIQIKKSFADLKLTIFLHSLRKFYQRVRNKRLVIQPSGTRCTKPLGCFVGWFVLNVRLFSLFENFMHVYNVLQFSLPFISFPAMLPCFLLATNPFQFHVFS